MYIYSIQKAYYIGGFCKVLYYTVFQMVFFWAVYRMVYRVFHEVLYKRQTVADIYDDIL